jgi:hypothetical protein
MDEVEEWRDQTSEIDVQSPDKGESQSGER